METVCGDDSWLIVCEFSKTEKEPFVLVVGTIYFSTDCLFFFCCTFHLLCGVYLLKHRLLSQCPYPYPVLIFGSSSSCMSTVDVSCFVNNAIFVQSLYFSRCNFFLFVFLFLFWETMFVNATQSVDANWIILLQAVDYMCAERKEREKPNDKKERKRK